LHLVAENGQLIFSHDYQKHDGLTVHSIHIEGYWSLQLAAGESAGSLITGSPVSLATLYAKSSLLLTPQRQAQDGIELPLTAAPVARDFRLQQWGYIHILDNTFNYMVYIRGYANRGCRWPSNC